MPNTNGVITLDLAELVPLTAKPHSPDNIGTVREMNGLEVNQVCIGSCTNSSYKDLVTVAMMLKGRMVHPGVSFIIAPGSKQVLENLAREGYLADLMTAGARIMENACGFCIGNSQSPQTSAVSLRTSNRNFLGRSGTKDAERVPREPGNSRSRRYYGQIHRSTRSRHDASPRQNAGKFP